MGNSIYNRLTSSERISNFCTAAANHASTVKSHFPRTRTVACLTTALMLASLAFAASALSSGGASFYLIKIRHLNRGILICSCSGSGLTLAATGAGAFVGYAVPRLTIGGIYAFHRRRSIKKQRKKDRDINNAGACGGNAVQPSKFLKGMPEATAAEMNAPFSAVIQSLKKGSHAQAIAFTQMSDFALLGGFDLLTQVNKAKNQADMETVLANIEAGALELIAGLNKRAASIDKALSAQTGSHLENGEPANVSIPGQTARLAADSAKLKAWAKDFEVALSTLVIHKLASIQPIEEHLDSRGYQILVSLRDQNRLPPATS